MMKSGDKNTDKPPSGASGSGKPSRPFTVLMVMAMPTAAVAAGVVYRLLRRRYPDRLVAKLVTGVALPPSAALMVSTDYWQRWVRMLGRMLKDGAVLTFHAIGGTEGHTVPVGSTSDWVVVVSVGLVVGPMAGAVGWLATQGKRERDPFNGREEREHRLAVEERRRARMTMLAQRIYHTSDKQVVRAAVRPLAVADASNDPKGPLLGWTLRGDLPRAWRTRTRRMRLPMTGSEVRHLVVLGATGLGKTEATLGPVAEWAVAQDWQVIYITAKEPPSREESAAPRLAALAQRHNKTFRQLVPQAYGQYDPMRGGPDQVRDRLIRIQEWGDEYWANCANLLVGLALELNQARGRRIDSLPELVNSLIHNELKQMASDSRDKRVMQLVSALDDRATAGALMRYASMALHLRQWIAPRDAGGWAIEDADVACIELPTGTRKEAGGALLRLIMGDIGAYLMDPVRRQRRADGSRRPVLLIVEEVGAFTRDRVIGDQFIDGAERWRSAGAFMVLTGQDPSSLGDERAQAAMTTNAAMLTYRQVAAAEDVAKLAGTAMQTEAGADYDQDGSWKSQGVMRRQHTFKLNPQMLRELRQGEFVVVSAGHWAKGIAAMTRLAYALPDIPEVRKAIEDVDYTKALLSGHTDTGPRFHASADEPDDVESADEQDDDGYRPNAV